MSEEKQIEEIAAIINTENHRLWIDSYAKKFTAYSKIIAEALHNARCRIIPEGAVILTAKEFEAYNKQAENIKRDTAREIFGELDRIVNELAVGGFDVPYFLKMYKETEKRYTESEERSNNEQN